MKNKYQLFLQIGLILDSGYRLIQNLEGYRRFGMKYEMSDGTSDEMNVGMRDEMTDGLNVEMSDGMNVGMNDGMNVGMNPEFLSTHLLIIYLLHLANLSTSHQELLPLLHQVPRI